VNRLWFGGRGKYSYLKQLRNTRKNFIKVLLCLWDGEGILQVSLTSALSLAVWWRTLSMQFGVSPTFRRNTSPLAVSKTKPHERTVVKPSSLLLLFPAWLTLAPWWWKRYLPPNRRALSKFHNVTAHRCGNVDPRTSRMYDNHPAENLYTVFINLCFDIRRRNIKNAHYVILCVVNLLFLLSLHITSQWRGDES
jgi:hypothetical protein